MGSSGHDGSVWTVPIGTPDAVRRANEPLRTLLGAVERLRTSASAVDAEALRRGVDIAQEVQAALAPGRASAIPGVEVSGWSPAASLSGRDCFDYWRLPDGRQALLLADVSERGPSGALMVAHLRALLRVLSEERADADWLLERANARLYESGQPGSFVTAFLGCLGADGRLSWCSAGQGPVYARRRAGEGFDVWPAPVPPLGVDPGLRPEAGPPLKLGPGGRLAVLSDGILDADNGAGLILGPRRLKTVLDNTGSLPLDKVVGLIRDVVLTWEGSRAAADDQSILIAGLSD